VIITIRSRLPTSLSRDALTSLFATSRWASPSRRETAIPSSEAIVRMPRPPTLIATRITTCPKPDQ
jgi:hypothetical protein